MKSSGLEHVVYVLSQQTGGPVDLTVGLAIELAGREGGPKITVVGPEPITSAGDLGELWRPSVLPNKFDVRSGYKLRQELTSLAPSIVHAQDRRSGLMTTRVAKAPQVLTYHGVPERVPAAWASGKGGPKPGPRDRAVLTSDAILARTTKKLYAPSTAMGTMLVEQLRIPRGKVEVLPNGVQLPISRPPLTEVRTIVFVGALIARKAVDVALIGFARAHETFPHLRFKIVGDGEDRAALERQAADLGVFEFIEFVGYRSDVPVQLSCADVFVLPSLNENQPLALLEAMGTGLACIATDTGGTAEVMPSGTGLLVQPGDPDGIADALEKLARDPAAAAEMAQRGATRARSEYSVAACADRHLAAYARLLDGLRR